jgi:hypothetical protein
VAVLTGKNGSLKWGGSPIGKVRSWSLDISRDALETTSLGVYDRTYVSGIRGATGSADIMYDPNENAAVNLLNSILSNEDDSSESVDFILSTAIGKGLFCSALITGVSPSVSVGEAQACSVSFQVSGPIEGGF